MVQKKFVLVKMITKNYKDHMINKLFFTKIKKGQKNYGFPLIHRQVAPIFARILLA